MSGIRDRWRPEDSPPVPAAEALRAAGRAPNGNPHDDPLVDGDFDDDAEDEPRPEEHEPAYTDEEEERMLAEDAEFGRARDDGLRGR